MKVEVSKGELVDKVAILKVKLGRIEDGAKVLNIEKEYRILRAAMQELGLGEDSHVFRQLFDLHQRSWDLIETWNQLIHENRFDKEYIEVTRAANECNRQRFLLKNELNEKSEFVEEKSNIYGQYKTLG